MKLILQLTYVQEPLRPCVFASLRFSFQGVFMRAIMMSAGIAAKTITMRNFNEHRTDGRG